MRAIGMEASLVGRQSGLLFINGNGTWNGGSGAAHNVTYVGCRYTDSIGSWVRRYVGKMVDRRVDSCTDDLCDVDWF